MSTGGGIDSWASLLAALGAGTIKGQEGGGSGTAGTAKGLVERLLRDVRTAGQFEAAKRGLQAMLDGAPVVLVAGDGAEIASRLQLLRAFFQFAPQAVWGQVILRSFVLEWVCGLASGRSGSALNPSQRGVAMSILGHFLKCNLRGDTEGEAVKQIETEAAVATSTSNVRNENKQHHLDPIGECVAHVLVGLAQDLPPLFETPLPFTSSILLHQCVEVLEASGDATLTWLRPAATAVSPAARLLQHLCRYLLQPGGTTAPPAASSAQTFVDSAKVFGMVAEVWMSQMATTTGEGAKSGEKEGAKQPSVLVVDLGADEVATTVLRELPADLLTFSAKGVVVHDAFLSAFSSSLDLILALDSSASPAALKREAAWIHMDALLQQGTGVIETGDLVEVMDVKRMELVVGLVGSAVNGIKSWASEPAGMATAKNVIAAITTLQQKMQRLSLTVSSIKSEESGSVRSALGDLRRGCISVAEQVIATVPLWVCQHRAEFWELSLRTLRTPALFAAAYCAFRWEAKVAAAATEAAGKEGGIDTSPKCEVDEDEDEEGVPASVFLLPGADMSPALTHICNALRLVAKYSDAVAQEILIALGNLCESGCPHVITMPEHPITAMVLAIYDESPKKGDKNRVEWKSIVLESFVDLLKLHVKHPGHLSEDVRKTFLELVLRDTTLIYLALGHIPRREGRAGKEAREAFGTSQSEELVAMQSNLIAALVSFLRLPKCLGPSQPGVPSAPCAVLLRKYLQSVYNIDRRGLQMECEGDSMLACCELELVSLAVEKLMEEARTWDDVLPAVRAICRLGGVDAVLKQLRAQPNDSSVLGDVIYETAREGLVYIAEALVLNALAFEKDKESAAGVSSWQLEQQGEDGKYPDKSLVAAIIRAVPVRDEQSESNSNAAPPGATAAATAAEVVSMFEKRLR